MLGKLAQFKQNGLTGGQSEQENIGATQERPPRHSTPLNSHGCGTLRDNSTTMSDFGREIELLKSKLNSLSLERDCLKQQLAGARQQQLGVFQQPPQQPPQQPVTPQCLPVQQFPVSGLPLQQPNIPTLPPQQPPVLTLPLQQPPFLTVPLSQQPPFLTVPPSQQPPFLTVPTSQQPPFLTVPPPQPPSFQVPPQQRADCPLVQQQTQALPSQPNPPGIFYPPVGASWGWPMGQYFAQPQPILMPSFRTKSEAIAKWGVTFSGDEKSNLQTFLQDIESQAKSEGCSWEELRRAAFYLFTGPAKKWYQAFGDEYLTWQELVEELKLYYLSPNNDSRVRRYIDSRRQKRFEPFMAYLADMELNFKKLSYGVSESEKVQTMKENLNPYFAEKMVLTEVTSMKDFKRFGRQIELLSMTHRNERINLIDEDRIEDKDTEEVMAVKAQTNKNLSNKTSKSVSSTQTEPNQIGSGRSSMKCFNCDSYGHHHNHCPEPKTRPFCYKCAEKESTTTNCTKCSSGNEYSGVEGGAISRH
jgi:hypothetical protein